MEGFFGRATRTLANNVESALMYAPPVLILLLLHRASWASHLSAETYVGARAVFAFSYWLKIPVVRSIAWFVGMICCAAVAVLAMVAVAVAGV
ncbi:MAG: MAPEG family protein [Roseiarcus sp.]